MVIDKETRLPYHELSEEGKAAYAEFISSGEGILERIKELFWLFAEFVFFFANSGYEKDKTED